MKELKDLIETLPPDLKKEVEDFVEFLLEKKSKKQGKRLSQDWAGALKEFRDQFTSLGLQKKTIEWREEIEKYWEAFSFSS